MNGRGCFTRVPAHARVRAIRSRSIRSVRIQMEKEDLLALYRQMVLIRQLEDKCAEMYGQAKIGGFLHLYNGQEAIAVGALSGLNPDDDVVWKLPRPWPRCCAARRPRKSCPSCLGATGTTGGRGGSMHLANVKNHFLGRLCHRRRAPAPLAAGLAVAAQYLRPIGSCCASWVMDRRISATSATLNWAQLWKAPVIFMVENNRFAMGTPLEVRLGHRHHSEGLGLSDERGAGGRQRCHGGARGHLPGSRTRAQRRRPSLVEAVTYRHRGQVLN